MPAKVVYSDENEKPDRSRYEMVTWQVPASEDFPKGLKYSFQYMDADGNTLLRYNNLTHHLDIGRHHRHTTDGEITKLELTELSELINDFQNEVIEIYGQRTD